AELGADAIGLNFFARSPRYVDRKTVYSILRVLPPFVEPIGLFVNQHSDYIEGHTTTLISTVQVHGDQPEKFRVEFLRWIPACQIHDAECLDRVSAHLEKWHAADNPPC